MTIGKREKRPSRVLGPTACAKAPRMTIEPVRREYRPTWCEMRISEPHPGRRETYNPYKVTFVRVESTELVL